MFNNDPMSHRPVPPQGNGRPMPPPAAMPAGAGAVGPPGAGSSAAASAPPNGYMELPPEIAQHIDPRNPMQMALLQRIDKLSPQDLKVAATFTPPQVALLKKVIPEIGFLFDINMPQGAGGAPGTPMADGMGMHAQPGGSAPQMAPAGAPMGLPRPTTKLGGM